MFVSRLVFLSEDDPWTYLSPSRLSQQLLENAQMNGSLWSSVYVTLQLIGLVGVILTLLITFARLAIAGPEKRNELKETILKKFVIMFLLFSAAFILGTILGVFTLL